MQTGVTGGLGALDAITVETLRSSASISEAARKLGIARQTLQARCKRRGVDPRDLVYGQTMPLGQRLRGNSTLEVLPDGTKRWIKTERASDDPPAFEPVPAGFLVKRTASYLDGQGQVRGQWITADRSEAERWERFWSACSESVEKYRGLVEPITAPALCEDDLATVYPLGDPHVGMLSWPSETGQAFDLKIAEAELYQTVDLLVRGAPESHIGVLANMGDFFHAQNEAQTTPQSGHKLDVDSRLGKVAEVGFNVLRRCIDRLREKHRIVYVYNLRGNHDPDMSLMLAMALRALYEREPRVIVEDCFNPYVYFEHGVNLVGLTHGDGCKPAALPLLMAADQPEAWGRTKFHWWYRGHEHHKEVVEYPSCVVETLRTLAPRDYWAHARGYRSGQALHAITLHKEFGEITRSTVDVRLTRAVAA